MSTPKRPSAELIQAVAKQLGSQPTTWRSITRGYTAAECWIFTLADARTVFVKYATDTRTSQWLHSEWQMYQGIQAAFMPELLGTGMASDLPFLILEDLTHATWPPPWTDESIALVKAGLQDLRSTQLPGHLEALEDLRPELGGWQRIAEDPQPFLSLKVCSEAWLKKNLARLKEAEIATILAGDELVHLDIRSDNLCLVGNQVKFIDWNYARRGNGLIDLVGWLPSLHLEDGPAPWDILTDEPELISLIAGYFAYHAPLPPHSPNPLHREFQKAQLRIALNWACRVLNLPIPEEVASLR